MKETDKVGDGWCFDDNIQPDGKHSRRRIPAKAGTKLIALAEGNWAARLFFSDLP